MSNLFTIAHDLIDLRDKLHAVAYDGVECDEDYAADLEKEASDILDDISEIVGEGEED